MSAPPPPAHALDLPEVLSLIASHLLKSDLTKACRVNKTWFNLFTPEIYRTILIKDFALASHRRSCLRNRTPNNQQQQQVQEEDKEVEEEETLPIFLGLARQGSLVRVLECPYSLPEPRLTLFLSSSTHLDHLTTFSPPQITLKILPWILAVVDLNRPHLRTLCLQMTHGLNFLRDQALEVTGMLIQSIQKLKNLEKLSLKNDWISPEVLKELVVKHLPSLKTLEFATSNTIQSKDALKNTDQYKGGEDDDGNEGYREDRSLPLTSLQLLCPGRCFSTCLELLERSLHLHTLNWLDSAEQNHSHDFSDTHVVRMARVLHGTSSSSSSFSPLLQGKKRDGPPVRHLFLDCEWLTLDDFYCLLSLSIPPNSLTRKFSSFLPSSTSSWLSLRSLWTDNIQVEDDRILATVWEGQAVLKETLEELCLYGNSWPTGPLGGTMVVNILTTFKKLKILKVERIQVDPQTFFMNGEMVKSSNDAIQDIPAPTVEEEESGEIYLLPAPQQSQDSAGAVTQHQVKPSLVFKEWTPKNLECLIVEIQGPDRDWCPQEVIAEDDRDRNLPAEVLSENDRRQQQDKYPLFLPIMAQLDLYPKLGKRDIRWTCAIDV
ncbi:hypothetical protein BGZ83_004888 [Gryganskiella cystojenkinii]|nr:hypothetical protein BGZ83_004888 [Gryganskiella cystojenkinii]